MSSLTISLLILAVAAIVAVVAVNVFQAMGRRKRLVASRPKSDGAGDGQGAPGADAALGDESGQAAPGTAAPGTAAPGTAATGATASGAIGGLRAGSPRAGPRLPSRTRQEPRLGDVDADGEEPDRPMPGEMADPGYGQASGAVAGAPHAPAAGAFAAPAGAGVEARGSHLSPLCDCIVTLELDPPVGGERLLALTQGVRRAGAKPILIEGLPAGSRDQESVSLSPANAYRALRLGVLLANRHGPLNAMEYSDFVTAVQGVADALAALADTPDMADAIARARDLDATCAQLDAQIGLNVDSPEPLGPSQIAALAGRVGLVDRGGHRHARLGSNGEIVFTMSFGESPQRLGFLLDVPRTPQSLDGWSAMLDCAHEVATTLSGKVVDDNGRPIPTDALATIARQLAQRYDSLEAIGLPAGSPLAMRVFN